MTNPGVLTAGGACKDADLEQSRIVWTAVVLMAMSIQQAGVPWWYEDCLLQHCLVEGVQLPHSPWPTCNTLLLAKTIPSHCEATQISDH
jgi:hypothetical protein